MSDECGVYSPADSHQFLRWTCDHLAGLIRAQQERHAMLVRKASLAVLVAAAFAAVAVLAIHHYTDAHPSDRGLLGMLTFGLLGFSMESMVEAVIRWFKVSRQVTFQGVSRRAFTDGDGTTEERDYEARYLRVRDHMIRAIEETEPAVHARAVACGACVRSAILACAGMLATACAALIGGLA